MSATDELRRMLHERGVKYWFSESTKVFEWHFDGVNGEGCAYATEVHGGINIIAGDFTPEQVIAATLGAGTCRLEPWEMERDTGYYDCMQCGCGYVADVGDWAEWHFCPNCGRRIEVDG